MQRVQAAANEGQTRPPAPDEVVALHFVALVEREGRLWELDGRKSGPVAHGPTTRDTLLQVRLLAAVSAHCVAICPVAPQSKQPSSGLLSGKVF
jgi:Ubiquitin carboxyl-terminal hydrolase, family 1